jgi:hypothetical protein
LWNIEWLFVFDLDGDPSTGRPAGSARIDPDLGTEVALGVYYDPVTEEYVVYFLAWDPGQGLLMPTGATPRFIIDESRTVVALSVPLETLARAGKIGAETRGRAAALSRVAAGTIIDFYPDLAE